MVRRKTSLSVDTELWKTVKKHCIDHDLELSAFISTALKEKLDRTGGERG